MVEEMTAAKAIELEEKIISAIDELDAAMPLVTQEGVKAICEKQIVAQDRF